VRRLPTSKQKNKKKRRSRSGSLKQPPKKEGTKEMPSRCANCHVDAPMDEWVLRRGATQGTAWLKKRAAGDGGVRAG